MESNRSAALRKARFDLSKNLLSIREICDYLVAKGELTDPLVELILSKQTRGNQVSELCSILATRGDSAYQCFREALIETNAPQYLVDKLPSFEEAQSIGAGLKSTGLSDDLLKRIDRLEINDSADGFPSRIPEPKPRKPSKELGSYPIDTTKKTGLALIINNVDFKNEKKRTGSDVDHDNMRLLLRGFNFEIFEDATTRNLTLVQMKEVLERFALQKDHQKYSCCIVIALSHGKDGYVYATDSSHDYNGMLKVEWMLDLFRGDKSPNLNGKPKLFFLQACRGGSCDKGADLYGRDAMDSSGDVPADDSKVPDTLSPEKEERMYKDLLSQNYDETDAIAKGDLIASHSDIFIAYSTVPGYVSWRNSEKGSWFIQAIVQVFREWAFKYDLVSMMTEVNRLVQEKFSSSSGNFKMVPSQCSQLTKLFYFPTKFPMERERSRPPRPWKCRIL